MGHAALVGMANELFGQEFDDETVELVEVEVFLNVDGAFAESGLAAFDPDKSIAITGGVGNVDIHVKGFFFGDDGGIEPGEGGEFVPQEFFVGPFGDVLGGG